MFTGCIETEYRNNRLLILKVVHKVHYSVGGRLLDLEDEATTWLFMKAVNTFDAAKGRKFSSHLYQVIWHDLMALRRTEIRREKLVPTEGMNLNKYCDYPTFDFSAFVEDLTDDARALISLAMDPPETMIRKKDNMPRLGSLRKYTMKQMKWTSEQFHTAVEEIRSAT